MAKSHDVFIYVGTYPSADAANEDMKLLRPESVASQVESSARFGMMSGLPGSSWWCWVVGVLVFRLSRRGAGYRSWWCCRGWVVSLWVVIRRGWSAGFAAW